MSEQKNNQQAAPEQDLNQQRKVRREKLAALQAEGQDPFQQTRFDWDHTSQQIKNKFDETIRSISIENIDSWILSIFPS